MAEEKSGGRAPKRQGVPVPKRSGNLKKASAPLPPALKKVSARSAPQRGSGGTGRGR
jgi:hypothetical protein